MDESTGGENSNEIFCPTCAHIFDGHVVQCPECRHCPACGALLFDEAAEECPSCEHPNLPERLEKMLRRLDAHADRNQRELTKLQIRQQNRELITRINLLKVMALLLGAIVLVSGICFVAGLDRQWILPAAFVVTVPSTWWLVLWQLRRNQWQWLLRKSERESPSAS